MRSRLRIAALVASSAMLGGIAVVIWHRRALEQMRKTAPGSVPGIDPTIDPGELTLDEFI